MKKVYILSAMMAVFAAVAVYYFASTLKNGNDAGNIPTVDLVIAKIDIAPNTVITKEMIETVSIPTTSVSGDMVKNLNNALGKVSPYPISIGEYLYTSKLLTLGQENKNGLAYSLEKGKRAITISVAETTGVGFYINSGDYIDIIVDDIDKTEMIFENVKVLKIGNKSTLNDNNIYQYSNITVSVNPQDALKLTYYSFNKTLNIVLRPTGDEKIVKPDPYMKQ